LQALLSAQPPRQVRPHRREGRRERGRRGRRRLGAGGHRGVARRATHVLLAKHRPPTLTLPLKGGGKKTTRCSIPSPLEGEGGVCCGDGILIWFLPCPNRARYSTRSGTVTSSIARTTAHACSTSTAISSMR